MLEGGTMRFSEIAQPVPHISDRLLSERMKELEARGMVERHVHRVSRSGRVRADADGPRPRAGDERAQGWADAWLD